MCSSSLITRTWSTFGRQRLCANVAVVAHACSKPLLTGSAVCVAGVVGRRGSAWPNALATSGEEVGWRSWISTTAAPTTTSARFSSRLVPSFPCQASSAQVVNTRRSACHQAPLSTDFVLPPPAQVHGVGPEALHPGQGPAPRPALGMDCCSRSCPLLCFVPAGASPISSTLGRLLGVFWPRAEHC